MTTEKHHILGPNGFEEEGNNNWPNFKLKNEEFGWLWNVCLAQ
jgi:hypothetical protein